MDDLVIRPATAADVGRIAQLIHNLPSPEATSLIGDAARATAFGIGLVSLDRIPNPAKPTVVAMLDDRIVGVVQYTLDRSGSGITLGHIKLILRSAGPRRFVRGIPRMLARRGVDIPVPAEVFYLAEIHVDPERRGLGIGAALLEWVDAEARRLGRSRIVLTTYSTNPARRLYERHGYAVTEQRNHAGYERYTGTPGRILMEKHLAD